MEYYKYITDKVITDYESLVNNLTQNFNIKFKEEGELFLMYKEIDDKEYNDILLVRNCCGLICNKNDLRIVCYSFDKCLEVEENSNTIHPQINQDNFRVEKTYEGSLIRVYYFNNKWYISTKRCIDAHKAYWISRKSFYELFLDVLPVNFDFTKLSIENCYSFLVSHPENNIIDKNGEYRLFHLSTRNMNTLEIVDNNIGICKPFVYTNINNQNINMVFNNLNSTLDGYMLVDCYGNRQKIESNFYKKIKGLWGNTNNRVYRYLELRKNEQDLKDYIYYFYSDCIQFKKIEKVLISFGKRIHNYYMNKNIKKTGEQLEYPYNKITYAIHGNYLKNRYPVTLTTVMYYLNHLESKHLYHYLNIFLHDKEYHGTDIVPNYPALESETNIIIEDNNWPEPAWNSDNQSELIMSEQNQSEQNQSEQIMSEQIMSEHNQSDLIMSESSYQIEKIDYQNDDNVIIIEPLIASTDN